MTDRNEALRLAELIGGRVGEVLIQQAERIAELEGELLKRHQRLHDTEELAGQYLAQRDDATAERDRLRAEVERLRADAERYTVLRCYKLSGAWPDGFKAPAGLLVFSGGLTQHELDKVLDDMLGYLPHPSPESVRADYQRWRRSQTLSSVAAIDHARTTHKDEG